MSHDSFSDKLLDKPLFDLQPALVGSEVVLILLGLLLAAISRRFSLPSRFDEMLEVFAYDGDGKRVKATFNGTTTVYVGEYYEKTGSTVKKYYALGGRRVAMRQGGTLYWLLIFSTYLT